MSSDNLALAQARIGSVLKERWKLEEVIGVGGMAAVYSAHHRNGARAAIKLLHGPLSEDVVVRERFLREAYLANSVDHVGVVRVLDDDADPKLGPFLVMELLDGESLLDTLERQTRVPLDTALDLTDQILDILAVAHERGIVHRDLKPANLFVCKNGSVKVLDFGIARLLDDNAARLTRTGVPLGTPAYMAPEQARGLGRDVDGRADLYALGATMFRTITGRHVHVGQGAQQIAMVATQRAPLLATVDPSLPPGVCAIFDHALEMELTDRYVSAKEMQADVKLVRAGKAPKAAPMRTQSRGEPTKLVLAPVVPRKVGAPKKQVSDAVTQLADAAREKAHAIAKRPDAFSVPRPPPRPAPLRGVAKGAPSVPLPEDSVPELGTLSDDDDDDDLPTVAMDPDRARAMMPSLGIDDTPPAPSLSADDSAAVFARLPNVPVPSFRREVTMPKVEEATTDPGAGPLPFLDTAPHPTHAPYPGRAAHPVPATHVAIAPARSFTGAQIDSILGSADGSGAHRDQGFAAMPPSSPSAQWAGQPPPVSSPTPHTDGDKPLGGIRTWMFLVTVMIALFFAAFAVALWLRR